MKDKAHQMKLHKNGKYIYASTQPFTGVDDSGKRNYKRLHWGTLDENLKFIPNDDFLALSKKEKGKFIFPENWDISSIYSEHGKMLEQSYNKLYGETWLLENIVEQLGIREDLLDVFKNEEFVNAILSLVYFRITSDDSFNHVVSWQKVTKAPYQYELTDVVITRLIRKITENDKKKFLTKRLERMDKDEICCIDSTSISCSSDTFVDAFMGHNKEGDTTMMQTNEVIVYGLKSHLPLYYRTVPGNMHDSKSLKFIINDLAAMGLEKSIMITDRGYGSEDMVEYYKQNKIPFIMGIKSNHKMVVEFLKMDYDLNTLFIPHKMTVSEHTGVFGQQYCLDVFQNGLRLNIYIHVGRRANIIIECKQKIARQERLLKKLRDTGHRCNKPLITQICTYFKVEFKKVGKHQTVASYEFREDLYTQKIQLAGVFASMSYMVDKDVHKLDALYHKRAEQEKVFMYYKSNLNSRRHRTSREETKIGRNFINFITGLLYCHMQNVRKQHLGSMYSDVKSMLREMKPIRYITHEHREDMITPFISRQKEIAQAFNLEVPNTDTQVKGIKLKLFA